MTISVRKATLADLGQIVSMQESHRREVESYSLLRFNKDKCTKSMATIITSTVNTVLVAHHKDSNKLLGYIWMVAIFPHYSNNYYYLEQYTYIIPEQRKGRILSKFIRHCKAIAIADGASYFSVGNFSKNEKLTEAYKRRYEEVGSVFNINLRGN